MDQRATRAKRGVPFVEFELVMAKLRHAFTALREGCGLLSPCNWVIKKQPQVVYLHKNGLLLEAIQDIQTILWALIEKSTHCKDLVSGWPNYVEILDASSHSIGGGVVRELLELPPTVFQIQWLTEISSNLVSFNKPKGKNQQL
jgi:hypothetical protein